jgi:hypothetical protein
VLLFVCTVYVYVVPVSVAPPALGPWSFPMVVVPGAAPHGWQGEGSASALYVACARGDAAITRMLLAAGANVHFLRAVRRVACIYVCQPSTLSTPHATTTHPLTHLAPSGLFLTPQDGSTPVHAACESGSNGTVFALINAGASVNGATAVSWLPRARPRKPLPCLCSIWHPDVDVWSPCFVPPLPRVVQSGDTPLAIATRLSHADVVATLRTAGAS